MTGILAKDATGALVTLTPNADPATGAKLDLVKAAVDGSASASGPVPGVTPLNVGAPVAAGRGVYLYCKGQAGEAVLKFVDGSLITIPVPVGPSEWFFAIVELVACTATQTTALNYKA